MFSYSATAFHLFLQDMNNSKDTHSEAPANKKPALFAAFLMVMVTLVPSVGVNATSALLIQGVVVLVTLVVAAALKFHYVEIPKHTRTETESWT